MPFDQYQRYLDIRRIANIIAGRSGKKMRYLDVGGHYKDSKGRDKLPAREFMPEYDILSLDIVNASVPGYIRSDANKLPFKDNTFDVVFSCDVLEHIPREKQTGFVTNLLRVSRDFVILGAPFYSEIVAQAETILQEFILKAMQAEHAQLKEHIDFGLPRVEDLTTCLEKMELEYFFFESGNLFSWLTMMIMKHYLMAFPDLERLHTRLDSFFNTCFHEGEYGNPGYRTVFVMAKNKSSRKTLELIASEFKTRQKEDHPAGSMVLMLNNFNWLLNIAILQGHKALEQKSSLQKQLIQRQENRILTMEEELNSIRSSLPWRLCRFPRKLFRSLKVK